MFEMCFHGNVGARVRLPFSSSQCSTHHTCALICLLGRQGFNNAGREQLWILDELNVGYLHLVRV